MSYQSGSGPWSMRSGQRGGYPWAQSNTTSAKSPYWTSKRAGGAAATGQFLAGLAKTHFEHQAEYQEASEKEGYAEQILANFYNNAKRQRTNLSRFVTERADEGGRQFAEIARLGDRAVGTAKTAVSASGAVAGEGTTQDVVVEQAFDAWYAQQQVTTDTYSDIDRAEEGYKQWKDAEYEQTIMTYKNLYRSAYLQREQAEYAKSVGMFSAATSALGSYAMMSA